jgi:hypothetical protein
LHVNDIKVTPRPVELKRKSKEAVWTTTWNRWAQTVTLAAPPDAIPFSSLFG